MRYCPHCGKPLPELAKDAKASSKGVESGFSDRMSYFLNPEGKEPPK